MLTCKTGPVARRMLFAARGCVILTALLLVACASPPRSNNGGNSAGNNAAIPGQASAPKVVGAPAMPAANSGRGGYYQDDGPGDNPPPNLLQTPDAEPKIEPVAKSTSRSYTVLGRTYTPINDDRPFKQRGIGSWYGKKFHGQRTASGERYDMYKMTAAHPTLPIPSYARVTSLDSGKSVIVRINDRGPFHASRITDLSYTAALKLGLLGKGSHEVEVERLLPDEIARINRQQKSAPAAVPTSQAVAVELSSVSMPPAAEPRVAPEVALRLAVTPEILSQESQPAQLADAGRDVADLARSEVSGAAKAGIYLQFGAYSQANNAETMRLKLVANWQPSLPPLQVVQAGSVFRLYSGPFDSRAQAITVAERMQNDGVGKALVVQR